MSFYIRHAITVGDQDGEIALYGPFPVEELPERLGDAVAGQLRTRGVVDAVELTDDGIKAIYFNSRDVWITALQEIEADE